MDGGRWKTMLCYNWPTATLARLTTDPKATCIRVVAMNQINFKTLDVMKAKLAYTRVVAFQPTGWSQSTDNALLKPRYKGSDVIISIPYSEHSSFDELVEFVSTFR